jgi:hypothetical protein
VNCSFGPRFLLVCGAMIAASALGAAAGQAPVNAVQPPSEIARLLAQHEAPVDVPERGQIRREIEKDAPRFQTLNGETTAMLLRLPKYQAPYLMTVSSFKRGIGPATKVFVPMGISFDSQFRPLSRFGDDELRSVGDRLIVDLMIGDKLADARYMLVFTRASQVQQRIQTDGGKKGNPVESRIEALLGIGAAQRSLEATLYVATGAVPESPLARKLGEPWARLEGANQATVQQLVGPPSSVARDRNATIWTYDKTRAGRVRVYIIDDVASLLPPQGRR